MRQLLKNETENNYYKVITKCDRRLLEGTSGITKCDRSLLEGTSGITKCDRSLLEGTSGITKCDRRLLEGTSGITKCVYVVLMLMRLTYYFFHNTPRLLHIFFIP